MSFPGFDWISGKIAQGAYAEAELVLLDFMAQKPRNAHALQFLALICTQTGRTNMALIHLKKAISLEPASPALRNNLANVLQIIGQRADALKTFKEVLRLDPRYQKAWLGISQCYLADGDSISAEHAAKRGLELHPNWPEILICLAAAREQMGKHSEALLILKDASFQFPDHQVIGSNYLLMLLHQCCTQDELGAEHSRIINRMIFDAGLTHQSQDFDNSNKKLHGNDLDTDIGQNPGAGGHRVVAMLGGYFRTHSVAYFAKAWFEHKPEHVAIHVFDTHPGTEEDAESEYFQNRATVWHRVAGWSAPKIAEKIRASGAEVLLELSGHTAFHRLDALSHRPAPKIVTALGYPHSLMHPCVDFRLTDRTCEPEGIFAGNERPLYMNPCFLCFTPPQQQLNCEFLTSDDPFTFGSSNAAAKITPDMIDSWILILKSAPNARLIVKGKGTSDREWRSNLKQKWERAGLQKSRLKFLDYRVDRMQHLNDYREIDVVLDTYPYNGTTTTCEALWMGVPVLTMMGQNNVSRVGGSILKAINFDDWVEHNTEAYVARAVTLAIQKEELRKDRVNVRQNFLNSVLCQGKAHAKAFFDAALNL